MKNLIYGLIIIAIAGCSTSKPNLPENEHSAAHKGTIIGGKYHHLEIVATHKDIQLYPLHEISPGSSQLERTPLEKVRLTASYSPIKSKANYSIYLIKKGDHFWGEIDEKDEHGYQLYIKMKVGKKTEQYIYVVRPKS